MTKPRNLMHLPLRTRLTIWYLLTLTAILVLFLTFLYWQVQRHLIAQMDTTLQVAAAQARVMVSAEGDSLAFQNKEDTQALDRQLSDNFAIYLMSADGTNRDSLVKGDEFPVQQPRSGAVTVHYLDDKWRVYSERIPSTATAPGGWLQVAQDMEPITVALASLRTQMLLGLPLALLMAGFVGFFLARRALRPIDHITQTAQSINAGDLSQRIGYSGPADEVGKLAATFDRMLDRLQGAFERQRRFTGDAAHELRTPLTALKGRIEVTLNRPRQASEYAEMLEEMGGQVDRLIHLSSDLLFMARFEQGHQPLQSEPIDLGNLLSATVEQIMPLAEADRITVHQDYSADLQAYGDVNLLIRLFQNVLDNAIKYTPSGGKVGVTAQSDDHGITVAVSDTGPGISSEHLSHLFERFYRVDEDRSRGGNGSHVNGRGGAGLGLAIASEIAKAHGGGISVESEVGKGSVFIVHLPRRG